MAIAADAGIAVFATGGIGGVHRGAATSCDESEDLVALGRYPVAVVSAGAKAILDLPKTVERLETLGVPVVGYATDRFTAFYTNRSPVAVAMVAAARWSSIACLQRSRSRRASSSGQWLPRWRARGGAVRAGLRPLRRRWRSSMRATADVFSRPTSPWSSPMRGWPRRSPWPCCGADGWLKGSTWHG
jgi:hypothetical protein